MYPSILQFCQDGIIKLDDICAKFFEDPTDIAGFVIGVKDELLRTACRYISDAFEELDEQIRNSALRSKEWTIVRRDRKAMLTSIGEISYNKTLYIHKKTGERTYLLDRILGLEENVRMTEDAEAEMLKETVQTSYRKGGECASILGSISKGTVKNHLHVLQFPKEETTEKRCVQHLYIDADEDHIAHADVLQRLQALIPPPGRSLF